MQNYKTGLMIFLFLAIIISLFPPYQLFRDKNYEFLFAKGISASGRELLFGELIVEYLLAGFFAFFVQIILTISKRKTLNGKYVSK